MAHTITMKEIQNMINQGVSTFTVKANTPRGCETVAASKIKVGDKVVIGNHFTTVIA